MKIGIVGCGVVGAAIAYTLSQHTDWEITVWDRRPPDQWEATGAALGVLMAVSRTRLKGKHVRLCLESLKCYEQMVPRLEAQTDIKIPYNREGIVQLCVDPQELIYWQKTKAMRLRQGYTLNILERHQLIDKYPELSEAHCAGTLAVGAIESPQDRQIDPVICTQALIKAAQLQGVKFFWQAPVQELGRSLSGQQVTHIVTEADVVPVDGVVVTSGLGSQILTTKLQQPLALQAVLGQALQLRRLTPIPFPYPVVNGRDVHLVPLNDQDLWVGATVEFPEDGSMESPQKNPALLQQVLDDAIAIVPSLAKAEVLKTWSGLRPRPQGQPAPIIKPLAGYRNVILATGHYRNGVLLAPITAAKVESLLMNLSMD